MAEYLPSLADVAALVRSRLKTEFDEDTTFSTDTKPTATMVTALIGQAHGLIAAHIGSLVDEKFVDSAKALMVLQTGLLIEPGYFAEQAQPNKSPWEQWKQMLDDGLEAVVDAIKRDAEDGDEGDGEPGSGGASPAYSFPACPAGTSLGEGF